MTNQQIEFNWYIILNSKEGETNPFIEFHQQNKKTFVVEKAGYRVYPIDYIVPFIYDDEPIFLVYIKEVVWKEGSTFIHIETVLDLREDKLLKNHYKSMYEVYKEKQEKANHGGKLDLIKVVNATKRYNFSEALKQTGEPVSCSSGVFVEWKD
ncbi:MAG: DUF2584 domain-containing protein [Ignavibacterium sp.]|nr:DUF2584 domain-containing protein [Ignavibacterium sp.]